MIYVGDELIGDIVLRDTAARLDRDGIERIVPRATRRCRSPGPAGDFDLVVVGNKGMTGSRRYIQRAVPSRVAHEAGSDVLIVRTVSRSFFDLRPGEGAVVEVDGEKVAAYLHDDGTTYALSAAANTWGASSTGTAGHGPGIVPATAPATNTTGRSSTGRPPNRCPRSRPERTHGFHGWGT